MVLLCLNLKVTTMSKDISILISSAGRRVELVKAFIRSSKKFKDLNIKIIACDCNPSLSAGCMVANKYFKISKCTSPNYINELLKKCLTNNIKIIIPTIDSDLLILSKEREKFLEHDIKIIISDLSLIKNCRNKLKTIELFKDLGIKTPEIIEKNNLKFPCFIKPIDGSSSKGIKVAYSLDSLSKNDIKNEKNIFQSFISKDWIEYTIDLYYKEDGYLYSCVPRQRIETRAGEISKGITRKDNVFNFVIDKLNYIKGARGVMNIQIFTNRERTEFLGIELNPRFGGGYPMSHIAGAEFPLMLIKEYLLNEKLVFKNTWKTDLLFLRHDEMVVKSLNEDTNVL
tara:strand:- start:293 stop:1318 length:1026 start_codon:yes stop_codon:yes gene_type:complete